MSAGLKHRLAKVLDADVQELSRIHASGWAEVWRFEADGRALVAKTSGHEAHAGIEHFMLTLLRETDTIPVPAPVLAEPGLLVMDHVPHSGGLSAEGERAAGRLIATLHKCPAKYYGLHRDTLIGPLHQPNGRTQYWRDFFRDRRLLYMAGEARKAGRLPGVLYRRIEKLAGRINDFVDEPDCPVLIHGDLWGGNILGDGERVAGFIDPAVYHGAAEMDLAFIQMFGSVGEAFFEGYREVRPIADGFSQCRDLYNLWPLLVHVRLFGGAYVGQVAGTLDRFGI